MHNIKQYFKPKSMKQFKFKRQLFVLLMLLCNVFVFADDLITEQVVVTVEEPGMLPDKISELDKDRITDLKVIGELNGTDVRFIREMAGADYYNRETTGNLIKLDLLEATFVPGGDNYCLGGIFDTPQKVNSTGKCDYFLYCCKKIKSIKIGDKVTQIGYDAFGKCSNLVDVELSSNTVSIGGSAFEYCSSLQSFVVPERVQTIAYGIFRGCVNLENIKLPESSVEILGHAFDGCRKLSSITIPQSLVNIGECAFYGCNSLEVINIASLEAWMNVNLDEPYSLDMSFRLVLDGKELENLVIPNSVKIIKNRAFSHSSIKTVTIPNSVVKINEGAFSFCSSLWFVSFPESLKEIGKAAFYSSKNVCYSCPWSTPVKIDDNLTFGGEQNTCTLYVPEGSYEAYRTADVWKDFGVIKTIGTDEPQEPKDPEPCSAPTITYISGTLSFESATPGAEYHYTINDTDVATDKYNTDGKVLLNGKLDISVYATADGYKASDKATATLYWLNAEGDDDTNNINLVKTRGVMVTTDNDITISGLNDGEVVTFYSVNGVNLGSAKAVQGVLHFAKPNESIVIAKIKGNDLKIAIK